MKLSQKDVPAFLFFKVHSQELYSPAKPCNLQSVATRTIIKEIIRQFPWNTPRYEWNPEEWNAIILNEKRIPRAILEHLLDPLPKGSLKTITYMSRPHLERYPLNYNLCSYPTTLHRDIIIYMLDEPDTTLTLTHLSLAAIATRIARVYCTSHGYSIWNCSKWNRMVEKETRFPHGVKKQLTDNEDLSWQQIGYVVKVKQWKKEDQEKQRPQKNHEWQ